MRGALRHRAFLRLWVAQSLSVFGDWLMVVAVPFFVYEETGSPVATAVVFAAEAIPQVAVGPFAGVVVDRVDRARVLLAANAASCIVVLGIVVADAVNSLWLLTVIVFTQSCLTQVLIPARNALVPDLVPEPDLAAANSLDQLTDSVARLVAPGVGGLLLVLAGLTGPAVVDAVTFAAAALILAPLARKRCPSSRQLGATTTLGDLREGIRVAITDRTTRTVLTVFGAVMFGQGLLNVGLIGILAEVAGATGYGIAISAQGVGGVIGAFLATAVISRWGVDRTMAGGLVGSALLVGAYSSVGSVLQAVPLSAALGVLVIQIVVAAQTKLQTGVDPAVLGRVSGVLTSIMAIALLFGLGAASALGSTVGVRPMVVTAAACLGLAAGAVVRMAGRAESGAMPTSER